MVLDWSRTGTDKTGDVVFASGNSGVARLGTGRELVFDDSETRSSGADKTGDVVFVSGNSGVGGSEADKVEEVCREVVLVWSGTGSSESVKEDDDSVGRSGMDRMEDVADSTSGPWKVGWSGMDVSSRVVGSSEIGGMGGDKMGSDVFDSETLKVTLKVNPGFEIAGKSAGNSGEGRSGAGGVVGVGKSVTDKIGGGVDSKIEVKIGAGKVGVGCDD